MMITLAAVLALVGTQMQGAHAVDIATTCGGLKLSYDAATPTVVTVTGQKTPVGISVMNSNLYSLSAIAPTPGMSAIPVGGQFAITSAIAATPGSSKFLVVVPAHYTTSCWFGVCWPTFVNPCLAQVSMPPIPAALPARDYGTSSSPACNLTLASPKSDGIMHFSSSQFHDTPIDVTLSSPTGNVAFDVGNTGTLSNVTTIQIRNGLARAVALGKGESSTAPWSMTAAYAHPYTFTECSQTWALQEGNLKSIPDAMVGQIMKPLCVPRRPC